MPQKRTTPYGPPVSLACEQCGMMFSVPASWARRAGRPRRYCNRACRIEAGRQSPEIILAMPFHRSAEGCRLLLNSDGTPKTDYVDVTVGGRKTQAHRIAWELATGQQQPDGKVIRHLCANGGNPACIEPTHLAIGTIRDNAIDAVVSGRIAMGARNGARIHIDRMPRGERHGRSKLTELQVASIRRTYVRGDRSFGMEALARQYGVGATTIRHIINGDVWKHV